MTTSGAGQVSVGRTADVEHLPRFLAAGADTGAALRLSGDPGLGKTALLETAAAMAKEAGALVLTAAALGFEMRMSPSTLNQLFSPIRDFFQRLNVREEQQVSVALGFSQGESLDPAALFDTCWTCCGQQQRAARYC